MEIFEELKARGLLAQLTDEDEIRELVNNGKAVFYIGFDPTADSLHVGHFMALTLMKRLQLGGNRPIALVGGGTAMIGDPSGRSDMRSMMTTETIDHNVECFKKQMSRFIDFGEGKAMLVNNADWLRDLNFLDFMRDIGSAFSVNDMLRARCYVNRLQSGLSFLEFSYIILNNIYMRCNRKIIKQPTPNKQLPQNCRNIIIQTSQKIIPACFCIVFTVVRRFPRRKILHIFAAYDINSSTFCGRNHLFNSTFLYPVITIYKEYIVTLSVGNTICS